MFFFNFSRYKLFILNIEFLNASGDGFIDFRTVNIPQVY